MENAQRYHFVLEMLNACWWTVNVVAVLRKSQVRMFKECVRNVESKNDFLDQPPSVEFSKEKILKETLEKIEVNYLKARLDIDATKTADKKEKTSEIIDRASKSISDAMVEGMKKLAELVDVDYFDVLPQIFGDDEAEKSERGQKIIAEVKEIYEKGDEYLEIFQKISNE